MTTTETIETATIAGQTWTIDRTFKNVLLLTNERGTTRMARSEGVTTMWDVPTGRNHAHRGNTVRIRVTPTSVEQVV